jgi:hypothetical protein
MFHPGSETLESPTLRSWAFWPATSIEGARVDKDERQMSRNEREKDRRLPGSLSCHPVG